MRSHTVVQSPAGYAKSSVGALQIGASLQAAAGDVLRENIRNVLFDDSYRFRVHPSEASAGLTSANIKFGYLPGNPKRYGALGDGAANDTAAWQQALNLPFDVNVDRGDYRVNNLTQTVAFQRVIAHGEVRLQKNANGPVVTSSATDVMWEGVAFRGGSAGADFTGDGFVGTGENCYLHNCGSRYMTGRAAKLTGNHARIIGTCDIYQTTDATAGGYDIELGVLGTATLYHRISHIKTSQAAGGILLTDCGSADVIGNQFGKLTIANGTGPAGVNGSNWLGNRVLGAVNVGISNAVFCGNTFGAVAITFAAGTSGHTFDESNTLQLGATVTDNSNNSNVIDAREIPPQAYALSWTGASVNPAIGNGTITARYSKRGRFVKVWFDITMGSTTTYGTGAWFFSLPAIPNTTLGCHGVARILDSGTNIRLGSVKTLTDGTARCQVEVDSDSAALDSGRPMAWASGDRITAYVEYFTN